MARIAMSIPIRAVKPVIKYCWAAPMPAIARNPPKSPAHTRSATWSMTRRDPSRYWGQARNQRLRGNAAGGEVPAGIPRAPAAPAWLAAPPSPLTPEDGIVGFARVGPTRREGAGTAIGTGRVLVLPDS